MGISIHPPRAGRDTVGLLSVKRQGPFQSTRPVRGGTPARSLGFPFSAISIHPPRAGRDVTDTKLEELTRISIHPPRAGRDCLVDAPVIPIAISIHPPRAGRDCKALIRSLIVIYFNPPAPCGAGRFRAASWGSYGDFNPPAPCGAGPNLYASCRRRTDFNPPAPCGAGPSA